MLLQFYAHQQHKTELSVNNLDTKDLESISKIFTAENLYNGNINIPLEAKMDSTEMSTFDVHTQHLYHSATIYCINSKISG